MRTALHLFALASEARWASGRLVDSDNTTDDTALTWGVPPANQAAGYAGPPKDPLEDGSPPNATIHMHPRWVPNGTIKGWLPWRTIGQRPLFRTKVGFIRGAGGEVTFQVWEHHHLSGREFWTKIAQLTKKGDGTLRDLTADLSSFAGQEIQIELRVDAGEGSGQDWAVWVDPQIEYDDATDSRPDVLTVTTAGNWTGVGSVVALFESAGGTAYGVSLPAAGLSFQFPLAALGLRRGGRYRLVTLPPGGDEAAWQTVPATGDLIVQPSKVAGSAIRFGDTIDVTATVWGIDPAGPSRQLGALNFSAIVGTAGLTELANRGLKAPQRVLDALLVASTGQRISVTLEPEEAFGILQPSRPTDVPLSAFPVTPAVGMPFQLEGESETFWVVSIQAGTVRLDVNHPWAGYRIRLEGTITATHPRESGQATAASQQHMLLNIPPPGQPDA